VLNLYNYIAERSGAARARSYAERIVSYCRGFAMFPEGAQGVMISGPVYG